MIDSPPHFVTYGVFEVFLLFVNSPQVPAIVLIVDLYPCSSIYCSRSVRTVVYQTSVGESFLKKFHGLAEFCLQNTSIYSRWGEVLWGVAAHSTEPDRVELNRAYARRKRCAQVPYLIWLHRQRDWQEGREDEGDPGF